MGFQFDNVNTELANTYKDSKIYASCPRQSIFERAVRLKRKWISEEEVERERGREKNRERKFSITYLLCL